MKTRFNNLTYEHFKVMFKGLLFEIKLIDDNAVFPNTDDIKPCHEFKINVSDGKKTISYKFYNSIMEKEISDIINLYGKYSNFTQIKNHLKLKTLKGWGGYDDKLKDYRTLTIARIENLFYSVVNCFANDSISDLSSFSWFCDSFGYDQDSRRAEKIYNLCVEMQDKINSLNLTTEQKTYLKDVASCEEEPFKEDIIKAIEEAKNLI